MSSEDEQDISWYKDDNDTAHVGLTPTSAATPGSKSSPQSPLSKTKSPGTRTTTSPGTMLKKAHATAQATEKAKLKPTNEGKETSTRPLNKKPAAAVAEAKPAPVAGACFCTNPTDSSIGLLVVI